jgi:hypothetical protein
VTARMSVPCPECPGLQALIEEAKKFWDSLSDEQKREHLRAQRRSWVIGEMLLEHPELTREYVEWILDQVET